VTEAARIETRTHVVRRGANAPLSLLGLTAEELRARAIADGLPRYRAEQLLRWIYRRSVLEFSGMTDLPREVRETLAERYRSTSLDLDARHPSSDGTQKLVLKTLEEDRIESVIIPEERRRTLCVSTQVGCSLDCSFCATGRLGLARNLRAEEIVEQFLHAARALAPERPTHIVFMGMGEPLMNLANVVQAIRILTDPAACGLSHRRITVSTAGVVPRLAQLGEQARVRLAISLHATTDAVRDVLVPLNRRFPIAELLDACRRFPVAPRDRISFEYTLIRDVNDSPEDADRLGTLLRGFPAKINLIPLNEHPGAPYRRPDDVRIERFVRRVAQGPIPVSLRRSRGSDILAACGQLGAPAPRVEVEAHPAAADHRTADLRPIRGGP
jgi:23S rRNA (adenine2503-C2)-methyltransferase